MKEKKTSNLPEKTTDGETVEYKIAPHFKLRFRGADKEIQQVVANYFAEKLAEKLAERQREKQREQQTPPEEER